MKKKACSNNCCYFSIHFVSSGATLALRCCVVQNSVKHNGIPFTVHCWSIGHCTFPYDIFVVVVVIHSCYKIWINGRLMLKALQLVRSIAILAIWSHLVNCCIRVKLLQNTMDFLLHYKDVLIGVCLKILTSAFSIFTAFSSLFCH